MKTYPDPARLVDHRQSMLLIDRLVEANENSACCEATIRQDNPFLFGEILPNWVLIEYVAQAVAVYAGYLHLEKNVDRKHGLLLGCRSMNLGNAQLGVGLKLKICIEEVTRLDGFGNFHGVVYYQGSELARGFLSVLESEDWPQPVNAVLAGGEAIV